MDMLRVRESGTRQCVSFFFARPVTVRCETRGTYYCSVTVRGRATLQRLPKTFESSTDHIILVRIWHVRLSAFAAVT